MVYSFKNPKRNNNKKYNCVRINKHKLNANLYRLDFSDYSSHSISSRNMRIDSVVWHAKREHEAYGGGI